MLEAKLSNQTIKFKADQIAEAFAFIEQKWSGLTKIQTTDDGTLVGLPYPYVVPSSEPQGGFVFDEMYYWDSYFVAQGLITTGHLEIAEGMLENLLHLCKRFHIIPNASRFYLTGRSQPPLLTTYILDIYHHAEKDITWLNDRMAIAEKEYQTVWVNDMQPNNRKVYKGLSRYYDVNMLDDLAECESGWDMTTRFQNNCLSYIPIDLNCLLYKYESDFARVYEMAKDHDRASIWRNRAALRAETIHTELWDEQSGFYFDKNYRTEKFSPVWSLAAYYTLWSGVATTEQARRMVDRIRTTFLYTGGLVTTAKPRDEEAREVSPQWAYPNGWAPLHWLISEGLTRYGYHTEAELIARRWINTNLEYFEEFDVFREAYNVVDGFDSPHAGVYPPQVGFGWTNAVFVDLAKKYLSSSELQKV